MCEACHETGLRGDDLCPVCNGTPDLDAAAHTPLPTTADVSITTADGVTSTITIAAGSAFAPPRGATVEIATDGSEGVTA